MESKQPPTIPTVSNLLHGEDVLSQHDSRVDVLIARILAALHSSDESPAEIAQLAQIAQTSLISSTIHSRDFLSLVFRKTIVDILQPSLTGDASVRAKNFTLALKLVDVSIALVPDGVIDGALPPALLELIFTFYTQAELSKFIPAIRKRFEAFHAVAPEGKKFFMIKAAMSAINRDKPGSNPHLTGCFRLMLAAALPTWHASGVNRRVQFNDSNIIDYNAILHDHDALGVDTALFKSFWRAQSLLSNATTAESPTGWRAACESIDHVLSALETVQPQTNDATSASASTPTASEDINCIPKYLTAPSVLLLQLGDARVRRQVLSQFAILLHHLETGVPISQPSKPTSSGTATVEFFKGIFKQGDGSLLKDRTFRVLDRDCSRYRRFVASLLHMESRWASWKKENSGFSHLTIDGALKSSPIFKRRKCKPIMTEEEFEWLAYSDGQEVREPAWKPPVPDERIQELMQRGNEEPWGSEIYMMELKEDKRDTEITDDMKRKNDSKYVWRTLRSIFGEEISGAVEISKYSADGCDLEVLLNEGVAVKNSL